MKLERIRLKAVLDGPGGTAFGELILCDCDCVPEPPYWRFERRKTKQGEMYMTRGPNGGLRAISYLIDLPEKIVAIAVGFDIGGKTEFLMFGNDGLPAAKLEWED